jgi:prolipoprotein diacylglyceryltransferase
MFSTALPVYPTQLFELAGALAGAALAAWMLARGSGDGAAFLAFVGWFSAVRWADWLVRVPAPGFSAPPWLYPALYATLIVGCLALAVARRAALRPDDFVLVSQPRTESL